LANKDADFFAQILSRISPLCAGRFRLVKTAPLPLPFNLCHRLQIGLAKASQLTDYTAHAIAHNPPSIRIGLDRQATLSA